ncbi:uncharacterized protein K02A2.6-like [Dendronephthya gigantea]|uniref:uncharacterized protein K02A2.6-like n=1 Tax=Dendronephthya gigantea TaxID=151771 RepID=UPI00106D516F|nr:uncharacterized protein K02A2.6-like [Dendronephthya gigantea]
MGSFDGAEICELVGLYALNNLSKRFGSNNIGLYRDDGLALIKGSSLRLADKARKDLYAAFRELGLKFELYLADTLSRNYLHSEEKNQIDKNETDPDIGVSIEEVNQLFANEDTINVYRQAINEDETLQALKKIVQSGWPETKVSLPEAITPYFHFRDELVIESGFILRGDRLIIPKSLRKVLLESLHASHQGIQSTLRRAREIVYWPNMNSEIKDYISKCDLCCSMGPKQLKETLICHDVPERPWAKIATDLFQFESKDYMITVDYFSNFFEIDRLPNTSARTVIGKIKAHVSRYGIPDEVVSDQGPQFTSQEFQEFVSNYGIRHVMSSPHFHQSNGKAEAAVKQAKRALRVAKLTGRDPRSQKHPTRRFSHESSATVDE